MGYYISCEANHEVLYLEVIKTKDSKGLFCILDSPFSYFGYMVSDYSGLECESSYFVCICDH